MNEKEGALDPTETLNYWLRKAAQKARGADTADEVPIETVCSLAGVPHATAYAFESGSRKWPRELDRLLEAYGYVGGLGGASGLTYYAAALWEEHGSAPQLPGRELAKQPRLAEELRKARLKAAQALEREQVAVETQAAVDQGQRRAGERGTR